MDEATANYLWTMKILHAVHLARFPLAHKLRGINEYAMKATNESSELRPYCTGSLEAMHLETLSRFRGCIVKRRGITSHWTSHIS